MSRSLLRAFPFSTLRHKPPQFLPILHRISHLRLPKSISITQRPVSSSSASATETLASSSNSQSPLKDSLQWINRTALCGELSVDDVGKRVRLCGWVALHRVHGGLTFLNLRDHTGIVQVTTLPNEFPDAHSAINDLRLEYVVAVEGIVRSRPGDSVNVKMKTGFIEVAAEHVQILNSVGSKLPFLVTTAEDAKDSAKEEIRLRYRYLDLRRKQMNFNIMLRHKVVKLIRRYLEDVHDFVEIETPILSRSTPEGARDYLVPSRVQLKNTIHKKKSTSETDEPIIYVKAEDEIFQKLCLWSFCFPLHAQPPTTNELKGYHIMGIVMAIEASKISTFQDELKSLISES